jgi:hypothetical protein
MTGVTTTSKPRRSSDVRVVVPQADRDPLARRASGLVIGTAPRPDSLLTRLPLLCPFSRACDDPGSRRYCVESAPGILSLRRLSKVSDTRCKAFFAEFADGTPSVDLDASHVPLVCVYSR